MGNESQKKKDAMKLDKQHSWVKETSNAYFIVDLKYRIIWK